MLLKLFAFVLLLASPSLGDVHLNADQPVQRRDIWGDIGGWFSGAAGDVGNFFTDDFSDFFTETIPGTAVYLYEATGAVIVDGLQWTLMNLGLADGVPATWECFREDDFWYISVPIRSVENELEGEKVTELACYSEDDVSCAYGHCNGGSSPSDNADYLTCSQLDYTSAANFCVIMGNYQSEPQVAPCAQEMSILMDDGSTETSFQWEGTACEDGDYANGDDECLNGVCVPSSEICRDDEEWVFTYETFFGPTDLDCSAFDAGGDCTVVTGNDGVMATQGCPVTCGTCGDLGYEYIDNTIRSEDDPEEASISSSLLYALGGAGIGGLSVGLVFFFIAKRKRNYHHIETRQSISGGV